MSAQNPLEFPCGSCQTTEDAAENGHLACLQYAHQSGWTWHPDTTHAAAQNGHLDCLQCAHESDCPWHPDTTYAAARDGHLAYLQYIYENCGDVATCEKSGLENFEQNAMIPEHIKEFLRSVQEDWKNGNNIGALVKPARTLQ